jgi:hypothetical protein
MKKNVLALSITAALIGLTGGAHAMSALTELQGATADQLMVNNAGIGHMLIVPYFTSQGNNTTMINIVNTDTVGKVVKVRFRGAANSDDLLDFQVYLSPKDVWTANVGRNAAGFSQISTIDNSCTKPNRKDLTAASFSTLRLDPLMTAAAKASGTREGYVEIFTVADIDPASALATAITHVQPAGVPPGCNQNDAGGSAAWTALDTLNATFTYAGATAKGLRPPTTGLLANWTIVDVANAATWSGQATAIQAVNSAAPNSKATGNLLFWPQTNELLTAADLLGGFSSDPIIVNAVSGTGALNLAWYTLDLPDFSTPYIRQSSVAPVVNTPVSTNTQADWLMWAISSTSATGEFWTESAFAASNDWVFSMPTRRYAVAFDYPAGVIRTTPNSYFSTAFNVKATTDASSNGNGRMICVSSPDMGFSPVNREEKVPGVSGNSVIVSPVQPGNAPGQFSVCGEVAVLSINNGAPAAGKSSGALKASVTLQDVDTSPIGSADAQKYGWIMISTPGRTIPAAGTTPAYSSGLPLLGGSFVRAAAGTNGFGAFYKHRFVRPLVFQSRD